MAQTPQLWMSFWRLTQAPPQQVKPASQAGGQAMPPEDELAPEVAVEVAVVDDVDDVVVVAPPAPVVLVLEVSTPPQPTRSEAARALKRRVRVMLARVRRTRGVGARA